MITMKRVRKSPAMSIQLNISVKYSHLLSLTIIYLYSTFIDLQMRKIMLVPMSFSMTLQVDQPSKNYLSYADSGDSD